MGNCKSSGLSEFILTMMRLPDLKEGQTGFIRGFLGPDEVYRCELLNVGLLVGQEVKIKKILPLRGPIIISFNGIEIALRRDEARNILVDTC